MILGHILTRDSHLREWIYCFHLPLFFFLSGLVLRPSAVSDAGQFVARRWRGLMVPYFCFAGLSYANWLVMERWLHTESEGFPVWRPLLGIAYGIGERDWMTFNVPLWFLPCMFMTSLLAVIVLKAEKRRGGVWWAVLASALIGFLLSLSRRALRIPWGLDVAFTAVVFLAIGFEMSRKPLRERVARSTLAAAALFALACMVPLALVNGDVDMNHMFFGRNMLLFYAAALTGIAFSWCGVNAMGPNALLSFFGRHSLGLLCIHWPLYQALIRAMARLSHTPADTLRTTFPAITVCLVVTVAVSAGLCMVGERWVPWGFGCTRRGVVVPAGVAQAQRERELVAH